METNPLIIVIQCLVVAILLAAIVMWPGERNLQRWIALALAMIAAPLLLLSRYQLGKSFAVTPQARELVTHGLYSKLRNPMYVFSALLLLSLILTVHKPYLFLILAVLLVAQTVRSRQEAKLLEEKFGDTYREYKNKTWF